MFNTHKGARRKVISTMPFTAAADSHLQTEYLVYDPWFPGFAEVLSAMPPSLKLDHHGSITVKSSFVTRLYPIIPAAVVLAHVAGVVLWQLLIK